MSFISSSYDEGETIIPTASEKDYRSVQDLYDKVKGTKQTKLMNNERAIEVIKNFVGCNLGFLSDEVYVAIEFALEKLEQPQGGDWIPVSERLPKNGNRVIVTNKDGQVFINPFWDHFRFFDDEIIAWQPLPEPYKKGDTE